MARKGKSLSAEDANAFVQNYFEQIESELTAAEFDSLKEGYECLRQLVVPGNYSEVAMTLITVIYSRRKNNKGELVTLDKLLNDTIEYPLVAYAINESVGNVSLVRLRELKGDDAAYVTEDTDEIVVSSNKRLVKTASAK